MLGGNYTCLIPGHLLADACVTDSVQGDDTVAASVSVDEPMARLSVIEAEQRTLKEDNRELTEENSRLKEQFRRLEETHARDVSNLTDYITGRKKQTDWRAGRQANRRIGRQIARHRLKRKRTTRQVERDSVCECVCVCARER